MAGPDPAAGWPNRTKPPTPAAAIGVDALRSQNRPLTISSCSTRWETGQAFTGVVQAGGAARAASSTTGLWGLATPRDWRLVWRARSP